MSESTNQDIISRLIKLEQRMNELDRSADAFIDELESLQAVARELKLTDSVEKFDKFIEDVGQIKEDLSCKLSDEIEDERMRELVETRMKTIPEDLEKLKDEYSYARDKLTELREEIRKSRSNSSS
ncbi:MAG: hypothetical protein ACPK85_02860 [Methanosarcina sp.]